MSIKRQFGSGVAWMTIGGWIEQAIQFGVFVFLARWLGAEAFGLMAMAAAFVILSEALVRESFSEFLISSNDPREGHYNAAFWLLTGFGALLSVILFLAAGPVANVYDEPSVRAYMQVLAVCVFLVAPAAVPVAILRRKIQFNTLAQRAVGGSIIGGIVAIWMALNGYGVWSLVGQRVVLVLTNEVWAWLAVSWRPGLKSTKQDYLDILGFGGSVLGLRGAEITRIQLAMIIIGAIAGPVALGLFSLAWRLIETASFLIMTPLRMVSQPAFAALTRQGQNAADLLIDISRLSGLIAFPAFVGLALLAEPVLTLMFGDKWLDAAPVLTIIAVIGTYRSIEMINQSFCLAAGRAKAIAIVSWVEVALAATLMWLVSGWGLQAMSLAFVGSFLILWIIHFQIIAGIAKTTTASLLTIHIKPLASAGVMAAGILLTRHLYPEPSALLVLIIGTATGGILFAGIVALTMRDRITLLVSFFSTDGESPAIPR